MKRFLCLLAMVSVPFASAMDLTPLEGAVIDLKTGQPLAGAMVAVSWFGDFPGLLHGHRRCFSSDLAVTNEQGRYRVAVRPLVAMQAGNGAAGLFVHKAGYEQVSNPLQVRRTVDGWELHQREQDKVLQVFTDERSARAASHSENLYLTPSLKPPSDRIAYLERIPSHVACISNDESERHLYPLIRAVYLEAQELARNGAQVDLQIFREAAAQAWLAPPIDSPAGYKAFSRVPEDIRRELQ